MHFTKMHGCGNDYIIINTIKTPITLSKHQIKLLCTPHFGIDSEGLLLLEESKIGDFKMRMFNIDGSESEMCGNGIRCISKYAYDEEIIKEKKAKIETLSGIKEIELIFEKNEFKSVKVNMGKIKYLNNLIIDNYNIHYVNIGNPHSILIVDDVENFDVKKIGFLIENNQIFENKTNVEFVQIIDRKNVILRVWERNCGETISCGSGSSATVGVLFKLGLVDNFCCVKLKGGILNIEIIGEDIFLIGNAVRVFDGVVNWDFLK